MSFLRILFCLRWVFSVVFCGMAHLITAEYSHSTSTIEDERARGTVAQILETEQSGMSFEWENTETGNSGLITIMGSFFNRDNMICREYRRSTFRQGQQNAHTIEGIGCRRGPKDWLLLEPQARLSAQKHLKIPMTEGLPHQDPTPDDPGWIGAMGYPTKAERKRKPSPKVQGRTASSSNQTSTAMKNAPQNRRQHLQKLQAPVHLSPQNPALPRSQAIHRKTLHRQIATQIDSHHQKQQAAAANVKETQHHFAKLLSTFRQQNGLKPVTSNKALHKAATLHASDMKRHNMLSHTGSNGSHFSQRAKQAGYRGFPRAENVARGQRNVQEVFQAWKNSPGHRRNMLNKKANEFGLARVGEFWTLMLGQK